MPITMAEKGVELEVKKTGGSGEVKRHLQNLGFAENAKVTVISEFNGNYILNVRDCRIALDGSLARLIYV